MTLLTLKCVSHGYMYCPHYCYRILYASSKFVLFCWLWIPLMHSQLFKNNLSHLKRITAIENLRFEIYLRFSRIQMYRIFYFLRRLFAKQQTLSSSSRTRSRKIRRWSISKFFVYCCHSNIHFTKTYILINFNLYSIIGENFVAIRQG